MCGAPHHVAQLTAVDLFCGCGTVTLGLENQGFRVVAAVDNDPVACQTYRENHPHVSLYCQDITGIAPKLIMEKDLRGYAPDLLVVCAPCQPFSSQNRKRENDPRAQLVLQTPRFARVLRPRVILFENVPGLASPGTASIVNCLRAELSREGYKLSEPVRVDAANYGVPQRRLRCIMFATTEDRLPELADPLNREGAGPTVEDAIGDLPALACGQSWEWDPLHFARRHRSIALERMKRIPRDGGDRFALPPELELLCHKGHKGHPDVYGRMKWKDVAPTLTTGCTDITRGRFMHPRDDRAISLREAARLQTFPDSYRFSGSPKEIAVQIGNAVPLKLVEAVAEAILAVPFR